MESTKKILEVEIMPQQKEHWCYASISEMLIHYYNKLNLITGGKYKKTQKCKKKIKKKTQKYKKKIKKKIKIGGTRKSLRKRKIEDTSIATIDTTSVTAPNKKVSTLSPLPNNNIFVPAIPHNKYENEQFAIAMKICNNNIDNIEKDQDPYEYLNEAEIIKDCHKNGPSWNLVVENINNNNPLIVLIGIAKNAHYLLLIGYSGINSRDNNRSFIYIDPYSGKQIIQNRKDPIILKYDESDEPPFENNIIGYCTTKNPNKIIDIIEDIKVEDTKINDTDVEDGKVEDNAKEP